MTDDERFDVRNRYKHSGVCVWCKDRTTQEVNPENPMCAGCNGQYESFEVPSNYEYGRGY